MSIYHALSPFVGTDHNEQYGALTLNSEQCHVELDLRTGLVVLLLVVLKI